MSLKERTFKRLPTKPKRKTKYKSPIRYLKTKWEKATIENPLTKQKEMTKVLINLDPKK